MLGHWPLRRVPPSCRRPSHPSNARLCASGPGAHVSALGGLTVDSGQAPCGAARQAGWNYLIAGWLLLSPHFSKLPVSKSLHLRQTNETPALFCRNSSKRRRSEALLLTEPQPGSEAQTTGGQCASLAGDTAPASALLLTVNVPCRAPPSAVRCPGSASEH